MVTILWPLSDLKTKKWRFFFFVLFFVFCIFVFFTKLITLYGWPSARSQILVYGLTGPRPGRLVGGAGGGILRAKSWNKVYSMRRCPFINNNGSQVYFILLPSLLVWIEIINIQKLITHVTDVLPFWRIVFIRLLYGGAGEFQSAGHPGARQSRRPPEFGYGPQLVHVSMAVWRMRVSNNHVIRRRQNIGWDYITSSSSHDTSLYLSC